MATKRTRLIVIQHGAWLAIMIGTLAVMASPTPPAKQEGRTVRARVKHASGIGTGIRAERVPGPFTVPEGCVATGFKYHFHDPADDYTSTRLGKANIYSITRGKWIEVAGGDPHSTLPPGKYKFVVGGLPGAYGSLSFKIVPTTETKNPDEFSSTDTNSLLNFDATYSPLDDAYLLESGGKKRLRDVEGIDTLLFPATVVVPFRQGKASSQFTVSSKGHANNFSTDYTLEGQFSNGRFRGIDKSDSRYDFEVEGRTVASRMGIAWSVDGQIDSDGLLVLRERWHHDFGEIARIEVNAQKELRVKREPFSSPADVRNLEIEIHLHLPAGLAPTSPTLAQDGRSSAHPPAVGSRQTGARNGRTNAGTPRADIWSDGNKSTTPVKPAKPAGDSVDWGKAANHGSK